MQYIIIIVNNKMQCERGEQMPQRNYLIKLREENELHQEDIAEMLGVTQQTISLLERGRRNPSIKLAKKFEILFSEPMEKLFPDIFLNLETTECDKNKTNQKPA